MTTPSADPLLWQRFLDGELPPAEAAALRARLQADPELQRQVRALQPLAAGFAAVRGAPVAAPPGFAGRVLGAVRRLPARAELEAAEAAERAAAGVVVLCRRLLLAAAVVAGFGLLWHGGWLVGGAFGFGRAETLQAAPADVQRELERLDARLRAEERGAEKLGAEKLGVGAAAGPGRPAGRGEAK